MNFASLAGEATPPLPVLTTIVVTPSSASVQVGDTQAFSAQGFDQHGNPISASVTWHSNDAGIVTINSGGVATGIGAGAANVTATSGAVTSNTAVLTVTATPIPDPPVLNKSTRYGITKQGVGTVTVSYPDSGNIVTRQTAGQAGVKLTDGTQQHATELVVAPDANFLASTTGKGLVPMMNRAQQASAGKSLAPEHE